MRITDKILFDEYRNIMGKKNSYFINQFDFILSDKNFSYLTKVSAIYSSKIEGNTIDLNSFMNYELNKKKIKPTKEIEEIEHLIKAYEYAQKNKLTQTHFFKSHKILSETLLINSKRGKYRKEVVGVFDISGLVYLAVEPEFVEKEMDLFFSNIQSLIQKSLSIEEVFYYASFIHLRFVHLHPFMDGNGRVARLLEKWFISEKLGKNFWKLPSEEYYQNNKKEYYNTIHIGVNFYELNYKNSLPFLLMLPSCIKEKSKKDGK